MKELLVIVGLIVSLFVGAEAGVPVGDVTASHSDSNVPANTLDGNLETRWSGLGEGVYIQYELETCETIESVQIAWFLGATRKAQFEIEVSENGTDYEVVFSGGESSGTTLDMETYLLDATHACFVRIVGYGNNVTKQPWTSITEVMINAAPPTPPAAETVVVPLDALREVCAPLLAQ